jgi:DNA-3-methyladenine glycosylase
MFLERGHAYVYISYGCWPMLNISAGEEGVGTAVLLRALEPVEGVAEMRRDRLNGRPFDIARGPGRLAVAMRISLAHDGLDMCEGGPLRLHRAPRPPGPIKVATRIGITKDSERLLRFFEQGNPHVSGPRSLLGP